MKRYLALLTLTLGLASLTQAQSVTESPSKNTGPEVIGKSKAKSAQIWKKDPQAKPKISILGSANGLQMRGIITPDQYREMLKTIPVKDNKRPDLNPPKKLHPNVKLMMEMQESPLPSKVSSAPKVDHKIKVNPIKKPTNNASSNSSKN